MSAVGKATLYWCDPEKNTECKKRACAYRFPRMRGGLCKATFRRAFARTDESGVPMVYPTLEEKMKNGRKE